MYRQRHAGWFPPTVFLGIALLLACNFVTSPCSADPQKPAGTKTPSGAAPLDVPDVTVGDSRQYLVRFKNLREQEAAYQASKQAKSNYLQERGRLKSYL